MTIQIILASTRPGRIGDRVAKWVTSQQSSFPQASFELIDLADYDLPHFNEAVSPRYNPSRKPEPAVAKLLGKLAAADGYVIVTPEYNHSFPAILKDMFDYLDFQVAKKPFAIVSYGTVGGARAAEQLKLVIIEAKGAVVPEATALVNATTIIDEAGQFTGDSAAPYGPHTQLSTTLSELVWWTQALSAARATAVVA